MPNLAMNPYLLKEGKKTDTHKRDSINGSHFTAWNTLDDFIGNIKTMKHSRSTNNDNYKHCIHWLLKTEVMQKT